MTVLRRSAIPRSRSPVEAFDRGLKTEKAVARGIKTTAGVVTSAAVVMVGVFSIFATLPILDMKEMGVGLAVAVLVDATIVRADLLPATMKLLGDWNWYLSRWLDWLPGGPTGLDRATLTRTTVAAKRASAGAASGGASLAALVRSNLHHQAQLALAKHVLDATHGWSRR